MTEAASPTLDGQELQGQVVPESTPESAQQPQDDAQQPQQEQKPELTEEQKRIRALERKLEKAQRNNGKLHGELEHFRQFAQQRQPEEGAETTRREPQEDPHEIARRMVETERINKQCDDIVKDGSSRLKGFTDSIKVLQEEATLFERSGEPSSLLRTVLDAADKPADVLHYLGSNPDEAAEIADLSPARLAKRIAQIEATLSTPPKASAAPAPIKSERPAAAANYPKPGSPGYIEWKLKKLSGY